MLRLIVSMLFVFTLIVGISTAKPIPLPPDTDGQVKPIPPPPDTDGKLLPPPPDMYIIYE